MYKVKKRNDQYAIVWKCNKHITLVMELYDTEEEADKRLEERNEGVRPV